MIIPDTSVWIEFFRGKLEIFHLMEGYIEDRQIIALECIWGELFQGVRTKYESEVLLDYWENLPKINELGLWIAAGKLSSEEKLLTRGVGLIDAAIIVAARKNKAKVWTLDKKLFNVLSKLERQ